MEKKEMIPLTKKEEKMHNKQTFCYIYKNIFRTDDGNKEYFKVKKIIVIILENAEVLVTELFNLRYKTPKEIPVVFYNGATYHYHFIIKEPAEEFEGQFECFGENAEKYIAFSVPIKKEMTMGNQLHTKQSLLIALDLCQVNYQILLIIYLNDFIAINAQTVNLVLIICQLMNNGFLGVLSVEKNYKKDFEYEYMDSWERFDKTLLPDKEAFCSSLNMENITDVDYRHAKRVFKTLIIKI